MNILLEVILVLKMNLDIVVFKTFHHVQVHICIIMIKGTQVFFLFLRLNLSTLTVIDCQIVLNNNSSLLFSISILQ